MLYYKINSTIPSPGNSPTFIEFSPNGRFLAVGDRGSSSLSILDRLAGFHSTISTTTPAKPTALVWETSKAFYVGLGNGNFVYYQIDVGRKKLVKGSVNSFFHGVFPATAIALDAESKTLVLSVGPDVFAFRRIRATSTSHSLVHWGIVNSYHLSLQANSNLSPIYQAGSTSKATREARPPLSQDPSALPRTTRSSLHFVAGI